MALPDLLFEFGFPLFSTFVAACRTLSIFQLGLMHDFDGGIAEAVRSFRPRRRSEPGSPALRNGGP
jgi:hypothetical protein